MSFMPPPDGTPAKLPVEEARKAANEALAVFEENSEKVVEVQKQCAGDLGKFFMMMIPLATELVSSVIGKYGFEENQAGAMAFVSELQKHQDDAEIKGLADKLKAKFMPSLTPAIPADEGAD
mmetsp:Transcript_49681/g.80161  ORF Transcript_49681/g.80161 Transcript_49681/m.80161 type:complete len:122 (+) Transcript_49681:24-389(+)